MSDQVQIGDPEPSHKSKKPRKVFIRKSLAMTEEQWAAWDKLANEDGALAEGGPKRGEPSWRRLAAKIANEAIEMYERRKIEALKEELKEDLSKPRKIEIKRAEDLHV